MTPEERTVILYRMERAREAIEEAKLLFDSGHINSYVNRLYYACFYAVSALLLTRNISTSKHGHLRSLLHKEFVKTGLIPQEMGKHFDLLFNSRQEGDYADLVVFKADEVADWLAQTETFVSHIESHISGMA
ncbi:MAG: HEPN domain-containing protein [Sedimentisphaerales bacterium]|nr:HEPN domain-containing protein [Sedimentisphaerales bacterium]